MRYRKLGSSDLVVSEISLGSWLTFFKGASLEDPARLFNSSLDGNTRRAIDIHEGEVLDANAFKALIRAAVALNTSGAKKSTKRK